MTFDNAHTLDWNFKPHRDKLDHAVVCPIPFGLLFHIDF